MFIFLFVAKMVPPLNREKKEKTSKRKKSFMFIFSFDSVISQLHPTFHIIKKEGHMPNISLFLPAYLHYFPFYHYLHYSCDLFIFHFHPHNPSFHTQPFIIYFYLHTFSSHACFILSQFYPYLLLFSDLSYFPVYCTSHWHCQYLSHPLYPK